MSEWATVIRTYADILNHYKDPLVHLKNDDSTWIVRFVLGSMLKNILKNIHGYTTFLLILTLATVMSMLLRYLQRTGSIWR